MASSSEKGHAKNIANAQLLCTHISQLGATYNPSNPQLSLANLLALYNAAFTQQETVNNLVAPYSIAVDSREVIFNPLNKTLTKLQKAYKATEGVTQVELEDFKTIARKLKGERKSKVPTNTDPAAQQTMHSTAQLSYDQRTNSMDLLIAQLQNTPNYNPNETEFKVATLQDLKAKMLTATQNVGNAFVPLNTARSTRNDILYTNTNNLVDTFNKAKDYAATILDTSSLQYKAIARVRLKKVN